MLVSNDIPVLILYIEELGKITSNYFAYAGWEKSEVEIQNHRASVVFEPWDPGILGSSSTLSHGKSKSHDNDKQVLKLLTYHENPIRVAITWKLWRLPLPYM